MWAGQVLDTIYIGGGTPTTLEPHQLERLLSEVEKCFDISHIKEYTVEAGRPDSITWEKLAVNPKASGDQDFHQSADDEPEDAGYHWKTAYGGRHPKGICRCQRAWV